jgi:hypothetical protein
MQLQNKIAIVTGGANGGDRPRRVGADRAADAWPETEPGLRR